MGQEPLNASKEVTEVYSLYSQEVKRQSESSVYESNIENKAVKKIIHQLFESFERYSQYEWGAEILPLFKKHFGKDFDVLWKMDK